MSVSRRILLLSALASAAGCSSNAEDFDFSIYASPTRTHAPGRVSFELTRDDGIPVTDCHGDWDFGDGVTMSGTNSAEHTYMHASDYEVHVKLHCGDASGAASVGVEVFDTVDLSVAALAARPFDVSIDGTLNVTFQVSNESETALQVPTSIDIYLAPSQSEEGYKETGAARLYRHVLQNLPASGQDGAVQKLEFDVPLSASIRTGAYYLFAVVNPEQTIGESDYTNNSAVSAQSYMVRNQATDGADLEAISLSVSPVKTSALNSASAQFRFVNNGSTTAEAIRYQIWMGEKDNADDMTNAVMVHESAIQGAVSGIEQTIQDVKISVTPTVSSAGLYYFWLILDSDEAIIERDEDNNRVRSSAPIHVSDEPVIDADISVESVSFEPTSASPGGAFTVAASLYNKGSQQTGSFICTVFLSEDMSLDIAKDYAVGSMNIDNLLPNSARDVSTAAELDTGIPAGNYWVFVFCDSSGVVSEANEDNNIHRSLDQLKATRTSDVDLVFGTIELGENSASSGGEDFIVSAGVCNTGSSAAGPFQLAIRRRNLCNDTTVDFDKVQISGLEGKSCKTVSVRKPIVCDFWCPSYQMLFSADDTQVIGETDERNNTAVLRESILLKGADCVCSPDKYEPNDTISTAYSVQGLDEDLTLCSGDSDIFAVQIKDGQSFTASVSAEAGHDALKFELYRGAELAQTYVGGDRLYLQGMRLSGLNEKPLYLRVSGLESGNANRYHINLDVYGSGSGVDLAVSDLIIEDNLLTASSAKKVSFRLGNNGTSDAGSFGIAYYISENGETAKPAWVLAKQRIDGLKAGEMTEQTISLVLPEDTPGGTYHLVIAVDEDDETKDTRPDSNILRSSSWQFSRTCWDVLDPNESIETARKITLSDGYFKHGDLSVCQNASDYYAIDIKDGFALDIAASSESSGDFDLFLFDVHGNLVDSARTSSSTEKIHRDVAVGDQTLYLEVRLMNHVYNPMEVKYSLEVKTAEAPAWFLCNSAFEPNDFFSSAQDLRAAAQKGIEAAICPASDEDFYAAELSAGERMQIKIDTSSTLLRAAVYNPDQMFMGMYTNLRTQTVDIAAAQSGLHYLRLFSNASSEAQTYTIRNISAQSGPDAAVSNLIVSSASPLAGTGLSVEFDVSNRGTETAETTVIGGIQTSSASRRLFEEQVTLAGGEVHHFRRRVLVPETMTGAAVLAVTVSAAGDAALDNNNASENINIGALCKNDAYEPNDTALSASSLKSTASGIVCPGDEDWFVTEVSSEMEAVLETEGDDGGCLKIEIYDSTGKYINSSDSCESKQTLAIPSTGTYYIRVRGVSLNEYSVYAVSVKARGV